MQEERPQKDLRVNISYFEIYKDDCFDLLVAREYSKLTVREDSQGRVQIPNLTSHPITFMADFQKIFNQASAARSTSQTHLNTTSSRSHLFVQITVLVAHPMNSQKTLVGKINLIDLAGSESYKNASSGINSDRMAEGASINRSLSVLGQVINALNAGLSRIPYRDSRLTRILKDALGGDSVALLVCNLAPGVKFRKDTLNTLNFATRAKQVENRPTIHIRREESGEESRVLLHNLGHTFTPQRRPPIVPEESASEKKRKFEAAVQQEVERRLQALTSGIQEQYIQANTPLKNPPSFIIQESFIGSVDSVSDMQLTTAKDESALGKIEEEEPDLRPPEAHNPIVNPSVDSVRARFDPKFDATAIADASKQQNEDEELDVQRSLVIEEEDDESPEIAPGQVHSSMETVDENHDMLAKVKRESPMEEVKLAHVEATREATIENNIIKTPPPDTSPRNSRKRKVPETDVEAAVTDREHQRKRLKRSIEAAVKKINEEQCQLADAGGDSLGSTRHRIQIARAFVMAARKAIDRGDLEDGVTHLRTAHKNNPDNNRLFQYMVEVASKLEEQQGAQGETSKSKSNKPLSKKEQEKLKLEKSRAALSRLNGSHHGHGGSFAATATKNKSGTTRGRKKKQVSFDDTSYAE